MERNRSFINDICSICGGVDIDNKVLSTITISCGYGSEYDGENNTVNICGKCADRLLKIIKKR